LLPNLISSSSFRYSRHYVVVQAKRRLLDQKKSVKPHSLKKAAWSSGTPKTCQFVGAMSFAAALNATRTTIQFGVQYCSNVDIPSRRCTSLIAQTRPGGKDFVTYSSGEQPRKLYSKARNGSRSSLIFNKLSRPTLGSIRYMSEAPGQTPAYDIYGSVRRCQGSEVHILDCCIIIQIILIRHQHLFPCLQMSTIRVISR
jgi:hypothetical protein